MKIYLNTDDINIIMKYVNMGFIDGAIMSYEALIKNKVYSHVSVEKIYKVVKTGVMLDTTAVNIHGIIVQMYEMLKINTHFTITMPITEEGLYACRRLRARFISVNMNACSSISQAILAAKFHANYVSVAMGQIGTIGARGLLLLKNICILYTHYPSITTQILVSGMFDVKDIEEVSKVGVDIFTVPPHLIVQMINV